MKHSLHSVFIFKLFFVFCIFNSSSCSAQNPDIKRTYHWYFGDYAGLDFTSGSPVADTNGQMLVRSGSATISDTSGQLLFYTDGKTAWNRNHVMMMNGDGLGVGQYGTPEDGVAIIPSPSGRNIYYIFTINSWQDNQYENGMRYNVVDMTQDNGKGAVVQKNIKLFAPGINQLAATKDSSGCGYWVASHEMHTANFRAYHITSAGLDTVPVISTAGIDYSIPQQYYALAGGFGMKFTPDGYWAGSLVSYAWPATNLSDYLDILSFNKGSGQFSSVVSIPMDTTNLGFGFSPNSQYLYYEDGNYLNKMWQIDISSGDAATILNSKTFLHSTGNNLGLAQDWQIGLDGKMYGAFELYDSLSVINNPNVQGIGCGVQKNGVSLNGRMPETDLPRFVSNFLVNDTSSICSLDGINETADENALLVYPNPASEMIYIKSDYAIKHIKITDIMGVTIYKDDNFRNKLAINCQSFANGIYVLQIVTSNHKSLSSKIIINH